MRFNRLRARPRRCADRTDVRICRGVLSFGRPVGEQAEIQKGQQQRRAPHLRAGYWLMQHMVVPTFVLDAERKVMIWNHLWNG